MHLRHNNCLWVLPCCPKWLAQTINGFIIICSSQFLLHFCMCRWALSVCAEHELFAPTAGTISGEELPIMSKTNIKEYRDSFSCERFTFRSNPNITFYVYVSNFSWPIKIQVRTVYDLGLTCMTQKTHKGIWSSLCSVKSLLHITHWYYRMCGVIYDIWLMNTWSYICKHCCHLFTDAELHCCLGWIQAHFILITHLMSNG